MTGLFRTLLFLFYERAVVIGCFRRQKGALRLFLRLPAYGGKLGDAKITGIVIRDQTFALFPKCAPPRPAFAAGIKRMFQIPYLWIAPINGASITHAVHADFQKPFLGGGRSGGSCKSQQRRRDNEGFHGLTSVCDEMEVRPSRGDDSTRDDRYWSADYKRCMVAEHRSPPAASGRIVAKAGCAELQHAPSCAQNLMTTPARDEPAWP